MINPKYWLGKKRPPFSEEWKRKISKAHKGKKHSAETILKLKNLRHSHTEKTKETLRNKRLGYKHSLETKEKIRISLLGDKSSFYKHGKASDRVWINKKGLIRNHKYRSLKRKSVGNFTEKEWAHKKEQCEFKCVFCGKKEPEIKLTIDHIVPLSKGGTNYIGNIQPLCKSCNSRKCDRVSIQAAKESRL